ncbi:MAG: PKD domain-containing protein, partial [Solirubrobacteraceae bacterium]
GVQVPDAPAGVGLRLAGVADDVAATAAAGATAPATAVLLLDGAVVRNATLDPPVLDGAFAADLAPGAEARLEQVRTTGAGVRGRAGRLVVERSRIDVNTGVGVLAAEGGNVRLDSALVRSLPGAAGGVRANQPARASETTTIRARHATIIGSGEADRPAISATASGDGAAALVRVDDSIVRGFAEDRYARADAGADAFVDVAYSNLDPATDRVAGDGRLSPFDGPGSMNRTYGSIRFVDAAAGDYRLRAVSPVIDRGTPGALLPDEPALDLDGLARIVDGNGTAGATRDMGAFEYQRRPPALTATAQPALARLGTPMHFEAQTSDPDPGDEVTVRWTFDDGTTIDGLAADHAFATSGAHTATVTATDLAGAAATRTVLVRTTPVPPLLAATAPAPADVVAPGFSLPDASLRLSRDGRVTIRVRCAAGEPEPCRGTLSVTLRRTAGGRTTRVTLASGTFAVPSGAGRMVRLRLRSTGRRLLRRTGRLRVRLTADARDTAGNRRTVRHELTLRAPGNAKREPSR